MKTRNKQLRAAIRTARFEVCGLGEARRDTFTRWFALSDRMREAHNVLLSGWEVWHDAHGSRAALLADLAAYRDWREQGTKGPPPKWSVQCVPAECAKYLYHRLAEEFPDLHARVRALLQQAVMQSLQTRRTGKNRDTGRTNLPEWAMVLLGRQGRPQCFRSQPILFDRGNSEIVPPQTPEDHWRINLRIDRYEADGKPGSHLDSVGLYTRSREARKQLPILERIGSGEYKFCGSKLWWDQRNRKWFVLLSYQQPVPEREPLGDATAILRPGRKRPWRLRFSDRTQRLGGRGRAVAYQRRRMIESRLSRLEAYHWAGSANKGHGRQRALPHGALHARWKGFVRNMNHTVSREVVRACIEHGCGRLVYVQPGDGTRAMLATDGKFPEFDDGSGWDWAQMAAFLGYKCQAAGIELDVRKTGSRRDEQEKSKQGAA